MKSILVVEDSEPDFFLSKVMIDKALSDVVIHRACDGEEALAILEEIDLPDLILVDINMPRMNGHEFLEKYSQKDEREIPVVVVLTSSSQEEDKDRVLEYKCVRDYIVKPLNDEKIEALFKLVD